MNQNAVVLTKNILNEFTKELEGLGKKRLFFEEYINQYKFQNGHLCHSRVLGVLTKIGHELGYAVDVERSWYFNDKKPFKMKGKKRNDRLCRPDISYVNNKGNPEILVDYSTIDQPYDVFYKILKYTHYVRYPEDEGKTPLSFIFILTLPKRIAIKEMKGLQQWVKDPDRHLDTKKKDYKEKSLFDNYFKQSLDFCEKYLKNVVGKTVFCLGALWEGGLDSQIKSPSGWMRHNLPIDLPSIPKHTDELPIDLKGHASK